MENKPIKWVLFLERDTVVGIGESILKYNIFDDGSETIYGEYSHQMSVVSWEGYSGWDQEYSSSKMDTNGENIQGK